MPISPIHGTIDTAQEQVEMIYIGYFGRAGDPGGVQFWINALNSGATLVDVARDFADQTESQELYPFLAFPSLDNAVWREQFISEIYDNLFNRGPDAGGLAYWSNILKGYQDQFNAGTITEHVFFEKVGSFILEVIAGATNGPAGQDVTALKNKVEVAECFTDHIAETGIDYIPPNPAAIDDLAHSSVDETGSSTDVDLQCDLVEIDINEFLQIGQIFDLTPGADRRSGVSRHPGQRHLQRVCGDDEFPAVADAEQ